MRKFVFLLGIFLWPTLAMAGIDMAAAAYRKGDYQAAAEESRRLADRGNAEAQYILGLMYIEGKGVPQDYKQAIVWLRKAAEQGNAEAQFSLGLINELGQGVPPDLARAAFRYGEAARLGHAEAQYKLGAMHYHGRGGVAKDFRIAAEWYRKAAEQGNAEAQLNLGQMYAEGMGVPLDLVRAYMWVSLAAASGLEDSGKIRDKLAKRMTAGQIEGAQRMARKWAVKHQKS